MNFVGLGAFLLILARITSFFVSSPFLSMKGIPTILKIGFSIIVSVIIFLTVPAGNIDISHTGLYYGLLIKEILVGLALGYITNLIFTAIRMAGQMTDFQLGFSMASVYDPITQSTTSLYGKIYNWLGLVLFFTLDGHYYFLYALSKTFTLVPVGMAVFQNLNMAAVASLMSRSFIIAFQIGMPVVLVAFMTNLIMGFVSRTVPQLNVFILGLPLKVLVGMISFVVLLPEIVILMKGVIEEVPYSIEKIIQIFQ